MVVRTEPEVLCSCYMMLILTTETVVYKTLVQVANPKAFPPRVQRRDYSTPRKEMPAAIDDRTGP